MKIKYIAFHLSYEEQLQKFIDNKYLIFIK